jgi:hypothetical protein
VIPLLLLVTDQISTCWLAKSTVQHKTQQHKTHNNQHEILPPYPPAALPSFAMEHLPWTQILAPLIPIGPYKARSVGCALIAVCSLVPKHNTLNIRERDVTLVLGGHFLVGQHNNQPKVGVCGKRDIEEGAQSGQNMWGGHPTIIWGGKLSNKKKKKKMPSL